MKVSIIRIDKKNQLHLSHKDLEKMLERMKQDKKSSSVEDLRQRIRICRFINESSPVKHELPHICPAMEMERDANGNLRMSTFNGILLFTTRQLASANEVKRIKTKAMALPSTIAAVTGASGRSVKIMVRTANDKGLLPQTEDEAAKFYSRSYALVFPVYNALLSQTLVMQEATLRNQFCLTLDPEPCYNAKATPFIIDSNLRISEETADTTSADDTGAHEDFKPDEEVATVTKKMEHHLLSRYEFRYNTVMGYTEYRPHNRFDFQPADPSAICTFAYDARTEGIKVTENDVRRYVWSNHIKRYDPIDEYLWQVHTKWDGRDHIRALARTVPTSNPHWEDWFYTWFLGMVAQWRGINRRYGNSVAPLLISRQGYNKSTFCRSLLPRELQWGFNENIDLSEKRQVLQQISQFLLINLDEFNAIPRKVQEGFLKNIIQLASVKIKRPYGRHVEDFPRLASFIATANMSDVLTDPTGSRRFIGVELTGPIDVSTPPNYEQLYAQAQVALENHEPYWFDQEQTRLIMDNNRLFEWHSSTEEYFMEYFELPANEQDGEYMKASTILSLLKTKAGRAINVTNTSQFGRFLSNLEGIRQRRTGTNGTEYLVKKRF